MYELNLKIQSFDRVSYMGRNSYCDLARGETISGEWTTYFNGRYGAGDEGPSSYARAGITPGDVVSIGTVVKGVVDSYDHRIYNIDVISAAQKSINQGGLIEGRTYTLEELNTSTFQNPKRFITEAYVVLKHSPPPGIPYLVISDIDTIYENDGMVNSILSNNKYAKLSLISAPPRYQLDSFALGEKYKFEVTVRNTSKTNISQNEFTLISADASTAGKENAIPALSVAANTPIKKSFVERILGWFFGLFKR